MRTTILAATAALSLIVAAGWLRADPPKKADQPKIDVGPGRVAWFDLTTTDIKASKEFYGKLFGWTFTALKETNLAVEIVSRDTPIGTIRVAEGPIGSFNGVVYVQVDDIRASCKKATELGGKIPPGFPFDLSDKEGAIALVVDPAGHPVGMYSRTPLAKAPAAK